MTVHFKQKIYVHFHGSVFPTKWKTNSLFIKMRPTFVFYFL